MFAAVVFIPMSIGASVVLMFLLGMSCSSYMIPFAIANEMAPEKLRGASLGFVNTISVGTAPILQPLVGYLLYRFAVHGSASHATMQYDVKDYHIALSAMLLVFVFSAAIVFFLPARRAASSSLT